MDPNISKIDGELLIDSTKQLNVLENKFNIVHDSHAVFSSTPNGKRTIAYVSASVTEPSKQELSLCSTHYHNKEKHVNMMKESALKGWHMPCDENELSFYSVTHEYGHMIQNILVENEMKLNGWDKENPRKFVDINKATKNARLKK